ncbi:MAG: Rieske (2Fe-2S) protein [Planctomycetota bacterium]|nr:Rieske (2Fe-2S) protein [Planctomycetota bacterium]MDA1210931.1 Rieske (2Fe-2S) protein [Planctomycetota bacterium]
MQHQLGDEQHHEESIPIKGETAPPHTASEEEPRRDFIAKSSSAVMAFGLVGGYGCFGSMMGQFLFPSHGTEKIWQFVRDLAGFAMGESMTYSSPAGETVVISRTGDSGTETDFVALSSICPHLGCQVHWELQNNRFFCPCHNGAFDPEGKATEGPPFEAGQSLLKYPLKIEEGMLFIEVSAEALV